MEIRKAKLSWEWVGAFIEAEGCLDSYSTRRGKANAVDLRIHIVQKEKATLEEICMFLRKNGVKGGSIHSQGVCFCLSIRRKADVIIVLENIIPFLRTKRNRAIEFLQWLRTTEKLKEKFGLQYWRYVAPVIPPSNTRTAKPVVY